MLICYSAIRGHAARRSFVNAALAAPPPRCAARPARHAAVAAVDLHRPRRRRRSPRCSSRVSARRSFVLLVLSLSCASIRPSCAAHLTRPGPGRSPPTVWMMLVLPLLLGALFALRARDALARALLHRWSCRSARRPLMSAPALAALMGLDAALTLATLIVCTRGDAVDRRRCSRYAVPRQRSVISPLASAAAFPHASPARRVAAAIIRRLAGQGLDRGADASASTASASLPVSSSRSPRWTACPAI